MVRRLSLHCSLTGRQIIHIGLLQIWALYVAEDPNFCTSCVSGLILALLIRHNCRALPAHA